MPKVKISSCTVQCLDGEDIIVQIEKLKVNLIDAVCNQLGIEEKQYFGLKYVSKDEKENWYDVNKPLKKQLKKASHKFKLGVQFYPNTIQSLKHELTRYQFTLQARENLLTGVWSCCLPSQALLASYVVQSEFGDYDPENHDPSYLNDINFIPDQTEAFMESVEKFHQKHKGLNPADIDWLYLDTARKTPMYGKDLFNITDLDGNIMKIGVSVNGVCILHMNTILHTFPWPSVKRCQFKKNEIIFNITCQQGDEMHLMVVAFATGSLLESKRIFKCCNAYKHFSVYGQRKVVKKPRKAKEVECTHTNDENVNEINRVDIKRFSKRFVKQSKQDDDESETDAGDEGEEEEVQDGGEILMINAEETPTKDQIVVPVITTTSPSQSSSIQTEGEKIKSSESLPSQVEGNDTLEKTNSEEQESVGEPDNEVTNVNENEQTEMIEYVEIDTVAGDSSNGQENETITSKVVEVQMMKSEDGALEVSMIVEKIEVVESVQEIITLSNIDDETDDSKNKPESLLEEIEKEIHDSFEILGKDSEENVEGK